MFILETAGIVSEYFLASTPVKYDCIVKKTPQIT